MAETLIFSEQTITTTYNSLFQCHLRPISPPPFSLVIGENYRVIWDGQAFDVTAVDCSSVTGEVAIGNGAAFGLGGNGEPFAVVYTSDVDVTFVALTDTEPTSHTVSVYHVTEESNIVLKDNNGVNQEYSATKIRLKKSDGTKAIFSEGEAIENVPITLDFSNDAQSQTVTAPPGQLVKSAVIQKPDALIPENIAEGVDIAGVIGSLVAGGGGNVVMAGGTFTGNGERVQVSHNLGVMPDLILAVINVSGVASGIRGTTSGVFIGFSAALLSAFSFSKGTYAITPNTTTSIYANVYDGDYTQSSKVFYNVSETTMTVGSGHHPTASGINYSWFAFGGLT